MLKDYSEVYNYYSYYPSQWANILGCVLTGILLVSHTGLGLYYKQWWMLVSWLIGIVLSLVGYGFRAQASFGYWNSMGFKLQYGFFVIVPPFIMAGIYYQMSTLITIYGLGFARLKPMWYTAIFITCDVLSIFIQGAGGGLAVSDNPTTADNGRWIIVGGIIFQVASMAVFGFMFVHLVLTVRKSSPEMYDPQYAHIRSRRMFPYLVPAVLLAWLFVFIRSIYRLVELCEGWRGYLAVHEGYFLVLEGLMMILCMITLTVVYPGFCYGRGLKGVRQDEELKELTANDDRSSFKSIYR